MKRMAVNEGACCQKQIALNMQGLTFKLNSVCLMYYDECMPINRKGITYNQYNYLLRNSFNDIQSCQRLSALIRRY